MTAETRTDGTQVVSFLRTLVEAGVGNLCVVEPDEAQRLLTEKRRELLSVLAEEDVESKRELARRVDRDISIVSRDLDVFFEAGLIHYEEEGRKKRPVLTFENVVPKPILWKGEVFEG